MILMSDCVKVEHVRQKRSWIFTTRDHQFGVNLCELKEINTRPFSSMKDEMVTLEHNASQEIEVHIPLLH